MYTQDQVHQLFANTNQTILDKIQEIKCTNIIMLEFNAMEGYNYQINLKILFKIGRYKLIKYTTNSSYLDDLANYENLNELQQQITEYWQYVLN